MLEKPEIAGNTLGAFPRAHDALPITDLAFPPIGNSVNPAVFRAAPADAGSH